MGLIEEPTFYEEEKNSPLLSHRELESKNVLINLCPRIRQILANAIRLNPHPKLEFPSIELIEKISGLSNLKYDTIDLAPEKDCKCDNCKCQNGICGNDCKCDDCKCSDLTRKDLSREDLSREDKDESDLCANMLEGLSLAGKDRDFFSDNLKEMDESIFKFAETMPTEEHLRIFKLDGERTFKNPERQKLLVNTLKMLYYMIGDYHQGEGFVTAYFLIFMKPPQVIKLVWLLHCFYVNGYFSTVPSSYIRDSIVFIELLKARDAAFGEYLENQITPQAYVSKWFIGLTIYVHSIKLNCCFIEHLVNKGQTYLFSYAITLANTLKDKITKHDDVSKTLEFLRLDNVDQETCQQILKESVQLEIAMEEVNKARKVALDVMEAQNKARKEREKAMEYSDDEIVFSDEE